MRNDCETCVNYVYDEDCEESILMRMSWCVLWRTATIVAHIIGWMMNMQLSASRCREICRYET